MSSGSSCSSRCADPKGASDRRLPHGSGCTTPEPRRSAPKADGCAAGPKCNPWLPRRTRSLHAVLVAPPRSTACRRTTHGVVAGWRSRAAQRLPRAGPARGYRLGLAPRCPRRALDTCEVQGSGAHGAGEAGHLVTDRVVHGGPRRAAQDFRSCPVSGRGRPPTNPTVAPGLASAPQVRQSMGLARRAESRPSSRAATGTAAASGASTAVRWRPELTRGPSRASVPGPWLPLPASTCTASTANAPKH